LNVYKVAETTTKKVIHVLPNKQQYVYNGQEKTIIIKVGSFLHAVTEFISF